MITLFPTGAGKLVSMPTYSSHSPIDASLSGTIANFPNEYEYLVVLYAAIKSLQQVLNSIVLADASIAYVNASVGDSDNCCCRFYYSCTYKMQQGLLVLLIHLLLCKQIGGTIELNNNSSIRC